MIHSALNSALGAALRMAFRPVNWLFRAFAPVFFILAGIALLIAVFWFQSLNPALRCGLMLGVLAVPAGMKASRGWTDWRARGRFMFVTVVGCIAVEIVRLNFPDGFWLLAWMCWAGLSLVFLRRAMNDSATDRIESLLRSPKQLNEILFRAGLKTEDLTVVARPRLTMPNLTGDAARVAASASVAGMRRLGAKAVPGWITVKGVRYLVPRLVRLETSPVGPRAVLTMLDGATEDTYSASALRLSTMMRVPGVRIFELPEDRERGEIRVEFMVQDPLEIKILAGKFFADHPAESPLEFPLAYDQSKSVYSWPTHHTLVIGATGSGKGSVLQGLIRQAVPFVEAGLVKMYGADPRRAELKGYERTSLFERVEFSIDGIAELYAELREVLDARQQESGRSFKVSKDNPLILVINDEFSSLASDSRYGKEVEENLNWILSQGRGDGIYVIAAAQMAQKEILGKIREHFANRIALRLGTPTEVDMVLGDGSRDLGATPHLIPVANQANEYRTAGMAFVRADTSPRPFKVRFPYTSDGEIEDLIRSHPRRSSASAPAAAAPAASPPPARRGGASIADLSGL